MRVPASLVDFQCWSYDEAIAFHYLLLLSSWRSSCGVSMQSRLVGTNLAFEPIWIWKACSCNQFICGSSNSPVLVSDTLHLGPQALDRAIVALASVLHVWQMALHIMHWEKDGHPKWVCICASIVFCNRASLLSLSFSPASCLARRFRASTRTMRPCCLD